MPVSHLIHAYRQAPWRTQRQLVAATLVSLIATALIAALYLNVSARAAITGREIQSLEAEINTNQRINADLETRIAMLLSTNELERRAREMGFYPAEPYELEYLVVAGYTPPKPAILTSAPSPRLNTATIPPEYTQSLLDWFDERMQGSVFARAGASR